MENSLTLTAFLTWVVGGLGSVAAANWLVANILEKIPKWHTLPVWVKYVAPVILALVLAFAANFALQNQAAVIGLEPYFAIFMATLTGYLGSQKGLMDSKNLQAQKDMVSAQIKDTTVQKQQLAVEKERSFRE